MAKEALVGTELTPGMVQAGERLVRRLDEAHLNLRGAFWLLLSESRVWRLVLVTPLAESQGPRAIYDRVRRLVARAPADEALVAPRDLWVVDTKMPLFQLLKVAISTGPGIAGIRFTGNAINGHVIEDAFIYRVA